MANMTLRDFSTPTMANIRTRPTVNVGDNGSELNPALINMVQANQFCGIAHEDASAHLQHFLEIYSTFQNQRSDPRCHTTSPLPILTLGEGKAMVLRQQ